MLSWGSLRGTQCSTAQPSCETADDGDYPKKCHLHRWILGKSTRHVRGKEGNGACRLPHDKIEGFKVSIAFRIYILCLPWFLELSLCGGAGVFTCLARSAYVDSRCALGILEA